MTMTCSDEGERADLMRRLRAIANSSTADLYGNASLDNLRRAVQSGEAQLADYKAMGFEDMAATR